MNSRGPSAKQLCVILLVSCPGNSTREFLGQHFSVCVFLTILLDKAQAVQRATRSTHAAVVVPSCRAVSLRDTARGGVRIGRPTHTAQHDVHKHGMLSMRAPRYPYPVHWLATGARRCVYRGALCLTQLHVHNNMPDRGILAQGLYLPCQNSSLSLWCSHGSGAALSCSVALCVRAPASRQFLQTLAFTALLEQTRLYSARGADVYIYLFSSRSRRNGRRY